MFQLIIDFKFERNQSNGQNWIEQDRELEVSKIHYMVICYQPYYRIEASCYIQE